MAYSEDLADRIRAAFGARRDDLSVIETKMMGGLTFMVEGHMACGIIGDDLMARVGRENHEAALKRPHVEVMAFTGRALKGFVIVKVKGIRTSAALKKWLDEAVTYVLTQPKKKKKKTAAKKLKKKK